ncbi:MAG: glycosyl hydrolase, partial [Flavobacteriaceae bacterium]
MTWSKTVLLFLGFGGVILISQCSSDTSSSLWPEIDKTTKPWTRWWWLGSAVEKTEIRKTLLAFHEAGLGGVEIACIYGVQGIEEKYIDFLSPQWMDHLAFTLKIADSLSMGVDMTLGTGWAYGGPQVDLEIAATKLRINRI